MRIPKKEEINGITTPSELYFIHKVLPVQVISWQYRLPTFQSGGQSHFPTKKGLARSSYSFQDSPFYAVILLELSLNQAVQPFHKVGRILQLGSIHQQGLIQQQSILAGFFRIE